MRPFSSELCAGCVQTSTTKKKRKRLTCDQKFLSKKGVRFSQVPDKTNSFSDAEKMQNMLSFDLREMS